MRLGRQDGASASSVGLAIAAATVAIAFITAEIMVSPPSGLDPRNELLTREAAQALGVIVSGPGITALGVDWATNADGMQRFGLTLPGQPNFLDYAKIRAMRNGTLSANGTNGAPDYPEVRAALGIYDADLHLRTYPVMPGIDDPRWTKEPHGRLAYFAHYGGPAAPAVITPTVSSTSAGLNVTLSITNDGGSNAIFSATIAIGKDGTPKPSVFKSTDRHTKLLLPGETDTVWATFPALAWSTQPKDIIVTVTNPYGEVAKNTAGTAIGEFVINTATPSGTGAYNHLVSSDQIYYMTGDTVRFVVNHYDGAGDHVNGAQARFVLKGPNGNEWDNITIDLPKQKNDRYTYECANCTTVGNYTAIVWDTSMTRRYQDQVYVSGGKMFTAKTAMDPIATKELGIVSSLVDNFNPTRYDPITNPEGDVFGDDVNGPSELVDIMSRYNIIIIGSEVSQTSLTPSKTKNGIAAWVLAGGNLIVLGTKNQQSQWLEPIYHASQQTANGGISAPDATHPVLTSPNRLQYQRYLDRDRAWRIEADSHFTHILTRGTQSNGDADDTLAVSEPGSLGNGTVVLTSYMAGAITDPQDDEEARRFMHNMLSQSYTMLFLDYGPPIPEGIPVGSASRLVAVPHPNVPGAVVEVRLVLYLFG